MYSFREYIAEGGYHMPVVSISKDKVDLSKPTTVQEINRNLAAEMSQHWVTPYGGWKKVCKILDMYNIEVPKVTLGDLVSGEEVVVISQFGHKWGAALDGTVTQPNDQVEPEFYLYYSYDIDDSGFYKCHAVVTDEEGLNGILEDDLSNIDVDTDETSPKDQLKVDN